MSKYAPMSAVAAPAGTSDADEFQLPVAGLFADMELARGSVHLPDEFQQSTCLVKLQVIRDWQRSLLRLRHDTLHQFANELWCSRPGMSPGERQALLRSVCESLRIELPADFASVRAEP
jgi:hypothetical protein